MNGGRVAEEEWLTGSAMGWQGPWGTTYPANLQLMAQAMNPEQWLVYARAERRPPMPWWSLQAMSDEDLTAMYHYIRSLGAKGDLVPTYVPPGGMVATPYFDLTPRNLPQ